MISRDRLDVPIWVDDFAQSRFVLAGELMRSWVVWDIFPPQTLLYVASADSTRPPRPVGIPQQLRDGSNNADPRTALSRERIYLETAAEPGSVGQCCLIFRSNGGHETISVTPRIKDEVSEVSIHRNNAAGLASPGLLSGKPYAAHRSQTMPQQHPALTHCTIPPPTPSITALLPVSEERGSARMETIAETNKYGYLSGNVPSSGIKSAERTPRTADAINSLAQMQTLAHAQVRARNMEFTPTIPDLPSTPRQSESLSSEQHQEGIELLMAVNRGSLEYFIQRCET